MPIRSHLCLIGATVLLTIGCGSDNETANQNDAATVPVDTSRSIGQTTVFLISIDGLRHDYFERAHTPNVDRLMATGAWSIEAIPTFPTLTFSSHSSISTGVKSNRHGVPSNSFYDTRTQLIQSFPGPQRFLEAEPFWTTATRQGVRTVVLDWVLSHAQEDQPYPAAHYGDSYTRGMTDRERVNRVLDTWEADTGDDPIRFILAYGSRPDSVGHRYGPDSDEVVDAVSEADVLLGETFDRAHAIWQAGDPAADDRFVFILLSDHGMSHVDYLVHLPRAAGLMGRDDITIVTGGNIGHLFFDLAESDDPAAEIETVLERLNAFEFIDAYSRDNLPAEWEYDHPYRTGDIVAVAAPGHTFSRRPREVTLATGPEVGPLGMHGYDPRVDPDMNTVIVFHEAGFDHGGIDLGRVPLIETHAFVAGLLGIEPTEEARPVSSPGLRRLLE